MMHSSIPHPFSQSSVHSRRGRSARGIRHLGTLSVSGRRRVPIPAASTMARIFSVIPICNLHRALLTDRSINGLKHSVCLQAVAPAAKGLAPLLNGRDKLQPFVIPGNIRAVKYQSFLLPGPLRDIRYGPQGQRPRGACQS